jgi:hypothetical protein
MPKFKFGDSVRLDNQDAYGGEWAGDMTVQEVYICGTITVKHPTSGIGAFDPDELIERKETGFDLFVAMLGKPIKFRSGCAVTFVAYVPDAKPHCQLVLLNPSTGNVVTRYANGKSSTETYDEPGDILVKC